MARIFKHKYADGHYSPNWYIEYRAYHGPNRPYRRRVVGFKDRKATEQKAAELEREAERIAAGLIPAQFNELKKAITEHLEDWHEAIIASGASKRHAKRSRDAVAECAAFCKWDSLAHMTADGAKKWLAQLEVGPPEKRRKASAQVVSLKIDALRRFGRWCVPKRLLSNPFLEIKKPQVSADRRHIRRAITAAEIRHLIDHTRTKKDFRATRRPINPVDRSFLYLIASHTGFRSAELGALRAEDIDQQNCIVSLGGEHTKNGEAARIPVPSWVVDEMRDWLKGRTGLLWPGNWARDYRGAKMLKYDLRTAGIPYRDERGAVFDLHALRYFYAAELARSGIGLQFAQKLMRHSSPTLTANIYTQLGMSDLAEQVNRIKKTG